MRLAEAGWVEDVRPASQAIHVLAHQVMALALQEEVASHATASSRGIEAASPFTSVRPERPQELLDTMVARDILYEADGLLSLGQRGEKLYGRRHFFELYSVFTAPPVMRVQHGKDDVGYVQGVFVSMHDHRQGPLCFRLSGRAWEVGQIDWSKGILHVRPADRGRVPNWLGVPGVLSTRLVPGHAGRARRGRRRPDEWVTRGAARELESLREVLRRAPRWRGAAPLEELPVLGVTWHTFGGGRSERRLLSAGLEQISGKRWVAGNLSVRSKDLCR